MPTSVEIEAATKLARTTLAKKMDSAKTPHGQRHFATQCYQLALETDQPASRYALLQMSAETFAGVNDLGGVMLVQDTIESRFQASIFDERVKWFTKIVPLVRRPLDQIAAADEATVLKAAHPTVIAARERLEFEPDNAKANEYLGRFLCFVKSQWSEGLPLLARADNRRLAELADVELQLPATADAKESLAGRDPVRRQ